MFDPITTFAFMWLMNLGLPDGRLDVKSAIETKEVIIIVQGINNQITLREGL